MRQNYSAPLRLGKLVQETDLSLRSFERLRHAHLKVSPRQLLTRIRVAAATELLRDSEDPIGRIALDCGFGDQATFCRQFKADGSLGYTQEPSHSSFAEASSFALRAPADETAGKPGKKRARLLLSKKPGKYLATTYSRRT